MKLIEAKPWQSVHALAQDVDAMTGVWFDWDHFRRTGVPVIPRITALLRYFIVRGELAPMVIVFAADPNTVDSRALAGAGALLMAKKDAEDERGHLNLAMIFADLPHAEPAAAVPPPQGETWEQDHEGYYVVSGPQE